MNKFKDKEALRDWLEHKRSIELATVVDRSEDYAVKKKRIETLLQNPFEFSKYYFPHYCQSDFAGFHKKFINYLVANDRCYVTNKWSRDHAKSVVTDVIAVIYLKQVKKMRNLLLVSHTEENATDLLTPLKLELETNLRLINDFGTQVNPGNWTDSKFVTMDGCSFRALGAGQSPRGARNQEARPDIIIVDDIDTEEVCRNSRRLDNLWEWVTGALLGCFSIKGRKRFIVVGNRIGKDCIIERAVSMSDFTEQIDILKKEALDKHQIKQLQKEIEKFPNKKHADFKILQETLKYAQQGYKPNWEERFTLFDCVYMITKMGYRMSQREYFNNPISEGKVFKKAFMQFKALPPMRGYKYLVAYLDPGFKKSETSDSKSLILVAMHKGEFHIRKVFCGKATIEEMIEWGYAIDEYVKRNNGTYKFKMEEVFLQSLLYKDFAVAATKKQQPLPVSGDKRKKPDKDARIAAMEGYFERGSIYFDEEIKDDHHCQALIEQLLNFEPGVKTLKDGPDALEGCIHILQQSIALSSEAYTGNYKNLKHRV